MAKQVILPDPRVQLLKEFGGIHNAPWEFRRTAHYTGDAAWSASDGNHGVRQVARMKEEMSGSIFWGSLSSVDMQFTEQFDVVVVGAGHAGCEAAMAAARMGLKTALYTLNVDLIAQMSCNPAVGGIAKGHLVREVDALGGIMGEVTDAVGIQFRLLNTSRGPAVWSPRAQCDKQAYRLKMREVLESQANLKVKQAEVADLIIEASSSSRGCRGIKLRDGRTVGADAIIITTGTFLNGLIHCGEQQYP